MFDLAGIETGPQFPVVIPLMGKDGLDEFPPAWRQGKNDLSSVFAAWLALDPALVDEFVGESGDVGSGRNHGITQIARIDRISGCRIDHDEREPARTVESEPAQVEILLVVEFLEDMEIQAAQNDFPLRRIGMLAGEMVYPVFEWLKG